MDFYFYFYFYFFGGKNNHFEWPITIFLKHWVLPQIRIIEGGYLGSYLLGVHALGKGY